MDRIPPEMIAIILTNLSVQEKLRCRLVCKKFKSIVDNYIKVDRLTVLGPNSTEFSKNWFFSNLPNDGHDLVFVQINFLLNQIDKLRIFSRLKRLFISFEDSEEELDFESSLNQLKQLKELNLHSTRLKAGTSLNLSQLEVLSLEWAASITGVIKLDTPKLSAFKSNQKLQNFQFHHPESIRYLFVNHDAGVGQFVNLEILFSSNYSFFRPEMLQRQTKLKQLQAFREATGDGEYDDLIVFDKIYQEKQRLGLKHLKMFVSGLEYSYYQNAFHHEDESYMILENYANTIPVLPFVKRLDYGDLLQIFVNGIPASLPSKLPNIQEISCLDAVIDLNDFFRFLKNCQCLNSLTLDCTPFTDQHHYDRLAELCKKLTFLHLIITDKSTVINFDFILNFKFLCGLILKRELPYEFIELLLTKLRTFKLLNFIYKGRVSGVTFNRNDQPPVQFGQSWNYFQFDSLEEFLKFLCRNRSSSLSIDYGDSE